MKKVSALLIVLSLMLSLTFGTAAVFADETDPSAAPVPATEEQVEDTGDEEGGAGSPEGAADESEGETGLPEESRQEDGQSGNEEPAGEDEEGSAPADETEDDGTDGTDSGSEQIEPEKEAAEEQEEPAPEKTQKETAEPAEEKETEKKADDDKLLEDSESGITDDSASKEGRPVIYIGSHTIEPGKTFDLSKHGLGSGTITLKENGTDIIFNKVSFSNEKHTGSEEIANGAGITLYVKNNKNKEYTLSLTGKNVIRNTYFDKEKKDGGISLNFKFEGGEKPLVTVKSPKETGSLEISGGSTGIYCAGDLKFTGKGKVNVKLDAEGDLKGIVSEGSLTVKDFNVTADVKETSGKKDAYGIVCKGADLSLAKKYSVKASVNKGAAFVSATGEEGDTEKKYEKEYSPTTIKLANGTVSSLPNKNEINLTSLPGTDKKYAYCETFYSGTDTSKPALKAEITHEPAYKFDGSSDKTWYKGSAEDLNAIVTRDPDDAAAFGHFTGIEVDGSTVSADQYTAESGSVDLTLKAAYLQTLEPGTHQLKMLFDDGSAETEFAVRIRLTINVRGNSLTGVYSGVSQKAAGVRASSESADFDISKMAFAEGKSAKAEGTDVGTYQMGLRGDFFVYHDENADVTFNITEDGTLTITPAALAVTTGSAAKNYDGKPLTNAEASLSGLVEGETATVTATGSQTEVGTSANTYTIAWDTAKQSNYTLSDTLGTLTVRSSGSGGNGGNGGSGGNNGSGGNGSRTAGSNVKTGDENNMTMWIVLIAAAGIAAAAAVFVRRRRG